MSRSRLSFAAVAHDLRGQAVAVAESIRDDVAGIAETRAGAAGARRAPCSSRRPHRNRRRRRRAPRRRALRPADRPPRRQAPERVTGSRRASPRSSSSRRESRAPHRRGAAPDAGRAAGRECRPWNGATEDPRGPSCAAAPPGRRRRHKARHPRAKSRTGHRPAGSTASRFPRVARQRPAARTVRTPSARSAARGSSPGAA